jgi:hypothetical protein
MADLTEAPQLIVDDELEVSQRIEVNVLDRIIHLNPALAQKIITLYSRDTDTGDDWIDVFNSENKGSGYPFRLTAALGSVANRQTMRFISFDDATDEKIRTNPAITKAVEQVKTQNSAETKEAASKRVGLLRLSTYAGQIAAYQAENPPQENPEAATA